MTISEFMAKWRKVELKERSAAQEHFIDLCNVFDHQTPAAADPILRPLADNIRCMDAILDCGTGVSPVISNRHGQDAHAMGDHGQDAHATQDANTAIAAAAKELNELREGWFNPPEWTHTETLAFPGTVGGPWGRYVDAATVEDVGAFKVGTVRYPRLVARDEECAATLKKRTLTNLYNERPQWLADYHARLDAAVAAAYGWPADLADEAILERLLEINLTKSNETD